MPKKFLSGIVISAVFLNSIAFAFLRGEAQASVPVDQSEIISSSSCDTTIVDVSSDANESYNYKVTCGGITIYFNDKATKTAGYKIDDGSGMPIEFKLQGFSSLTPTVSGNTLSYTVTILGISFTLKFTVTDIKVKEEFIINTRPSDVILNLLPASMTFTFDLSKAGLAAVTSGDTVLLNDATTGETIYIIPKLIYTDANGVGGTISLATTDTTATLTIDTNFLKTATYPVTVDPTVEVATSSVSQATSRSTMRKLVRTSDGTLHNFIQTGTSTMSCGGSNLSGLLWVYSTDSGSTWTCGAQFNSNAVLASAALDSSDNIYVVYARVAAGAGGALDVGYRKLTKGSGSSWTVGSEDVVLDGTASDGYTAAVTELEGTTRLWVAAKHFVSGTSDYRIEVYYSDGLTDNPTWTQSISPLDTAGGSNNFHVPTIVRFGSSIGVIYSDQGTAGDLKWRYRSDSDALGSWVAESTVTASTSMTDLTFYVISDTSNKIYLAAGDGSDVFFTYYDGATWSSAVTLSSTAMTDSFVGLSTDNTNVWVLYGEGANLSAGLSGGRKLVYKKGSSPFGSSNFSSETNFVSYHRTFDKVWSFVGGAYSDETADAASTTTGDVQMVTSTDDIIYFGMTEKFDAISWDLSTAGVGGTIQWEYWNGGSWSSLTFDPASNPNLTADGSGAYTAPSDWSTTSINSESTSYFYIRARATANYSTSPVGVMAAAIPQINWATALPKIEAFGSLYAFWTENSASPAKIRFSKNDVATKSLELLDPGENVFANSTRPAFSFRKATYSGGGLSGYDLLIDEGKVGQFSIVGIPKDYASSGCSGETGAERTCNKGKYTVVYHNEHDSDSTNDFIKVHTNSSGNWISTENDGMLKEGKRTWKVKARDAVTNEQSSSRDLGVDLSAPGILLDKYSDGGVYSSGGSLIISGTVADKKEGYEFSSGNKTKVRSDPDKVGIKVEKEGVVLTSLYDISISALSGTCASGLDSSTSETCSKTFSYTVPSSLPNAKYKVTVSGRDKAGNSKTVSFHILVGVSEEQVEKIIERLEEKPGITLTPEIEEAIEKVTQTFEETGQIVLTSLKRTAEVLKLLSLRFSQALGNFQASTAQVASNVSSALVSLVDQVPQLKEVREGLASLTVPVVGAVGGGIQTLNQTLGQVKDTVLTVIVSSIDPVLVLLDPTPTKITNVEVVDIKSEKVTLKFSTNHPTVGKINYGEDTSYGMEKFFDEKERDHELILDGLKPGKKYYFEIVAQGKNVAVDAYRTFETPPEGEVQGESTSADKLLIVKGDPEDTVLIRLEPTTRASAISQVKGGATLTFRNHIDNWIEVKIDGDWGWIFGALTESLEP